MCFNGGVIWATMGKPAGKSRGVLRETYWELLRDPDRHASGSVDTGTPARRPTRNHVTGSSAGSVFLFVEYRGMPWNPVGTYKNPRNTLGKKLFPAVQSLFPWDVPLVPVKGKHGPPWDTMVYRGFPRVSVSISRDNTTFYMTC